MSRSFSKDILDPDHFVMTLYKNIGHSWNMPNLKMGFSGNEATSVSAI